MCVYFKEWKLHQFVLYLSINTLHIYGFISTYYIYLFLFYCALIHKIKAYITIIFECFNVLSFQTRDVCIIFIWQIVNFKST